MERSVGRGGKPGLWKKSQMGAAAHYTRNRL